MFSPASLENAGIATTVNQRRAICVTSFGSILRGVLCSMMERQDSPKMDSPFTTLLAPPHLANTLLFMLAALPRSTLQLHLTKFVYLVVEYPQVGVLRLKNNNDISNNILDDFHFPLIYLFICLKVWVPL